MSRMCKKCKVILDVYEDEKKDFLDAFIILGALEKQGQMLTRGGLSNLIRSKLENKHLRPSRDACGIIVGWSLIKRQEREILNSSKNNIFGRNGLFFDDEKIIEVETIGQTNI